jgi:hypothetical protein
MCTFIASRVFYKLISICFSLSCVFILQAFEMLVTSKAFVAAAAPSATMACEFVRYRCVVERGDIKKATEEMGQTNLKKWLSKAQ